MAETVLAAVRTAPRATELREFQLPEIPSQRFSLELLTTREFGLADTERTIRAVGGHVGEGVVHVSLLPWQA